jgi:hypothetical protein
VRWVTPNNFWIKIVLSSYSNNMPNFKKFYWIVLIPPKCLANVLKVFRCRFFCILQEFLHPFVNYHRIISFCLYVAGFVSFVVSLRKRHYLKQFTMVIMYLYYLCKSSQFYLSFFTNLSTCQCCVRGEQRMLRGEFLWRQ